MRHLDLFSGIGGFALAAKWAGFETVAFCENDDYCQKVLRKNFGSGIVIHDDITKLDGREYAGTIDLLTGGFPCQPYSVAGKRRGDDDDRALWREMLRVIENVQPAWVVGENVANFVNMALDPLLAEMESRGYEAIPFVIPAAGVGAPHQRSRTFIVAHSNRIGRRTSWTSQMETTSTVETIATSTYVGDSSVGRCSRKSRRGTGTVTEDGYLQLETRNAPDAQGTELQRRRHPRSGWDGFTNCGERIAYPDGEPMGWSTIARYQRGQWATEPNVGRVANGVPSRVDRLRGLGNAVVPQQVYPILATIAELQFAAPLGAQP